MKVSRIIFADQKGNTRSAMAKGLFEKMYPDSHLEVLARGLVVSFAEPLNQKAEAVMAGKGMNTEGFQSTQLSDKDITQETLVLAMTKKQQADIIRDYEEANENNTFVLSDFVGEELEIMDPYGGSLQVYGICLEALRSTIEKIPEAIRGREDERQEN